MQRLVFDIEANGLLPEVSKIWCLAYFNIDSAEKGVLVQDEVNLETVSSLFKDKIIIGHNIYNYDLPLLEKFTGVKWLVEQPIEQTIDTFLWSQIENPDRELPKGCPTSVMNQITKKRKLITPHSLEAWGYFFGDKKIAVDDWTVFDSEKLVRCEKDVEITTKVFHYLFNKMGVSM